jgi:hypothetical protein
MATVEREESSIYWRSNTRVANPMATAEQDLANFTSFVLHKVEAGERDLNIDELFDLWRTENPSDEQYAESVAAIQASLQDFKNGERGTLAGEHSAELRREFGLDSE